MFTTISPSRAFWYRLLRLCFFWFFRPSGEQQPDFDAVPQPLPKSQTVPALQSLAPVQKLGHSNADLLGGLLIEMPGSSGLAPVAPAVSQGNPPNLFAPASSFGDPVFSSSWQSGANAPGGALGTGTALPVGQQSQMLMQQYGMNNPLPEPSLLDTSDLKLNDGGGILAPSVKPFLTDSAVSTRPAVSQQWFYF